VDERAYPTSDRRVIRWLLLVLLALVVAAYAAAWYYTGDRVASGTTIDGVRIGGLPPAAARRALGNGLADRAAASIVLSANGEPAVIRPATAGLSVDLDRTIEAVTQHRSWDPRRIWQYAAGGTDRDPVVRVDKTALAEVVAAVADQVDEPAVTGSVGFRDGEPVAHYPRPGTVVDRRAAVRTVRRAFLHHFGAADVVVLPTRTDPSPMTATAVSRAMDEFANPAMSGSVVFRFAGRSVRLQPQDFSAALSMRAVGSRLEPRLDDRRLLRLVGPRLAPAERAPRDATVRMVAGQARIVPARDGLRFSSRDVTGPLLQVLRRPGGERVVDVRETRVRPHLSTEDARVLWIRERGSSFGCTPSTGARTRSAAPRLPAPTGVRRRSPAPGTSARPPAPWSGRCPWRAASVRSTATPARRGPGL
jgi:vancomycin resistance protein YoaR